MKKAVEADELARFVKADEVAHPAEQRNIGDAVMSQLLITVPDEFFQ